MMEVKTQIKEFFRPWMALRTIGLTADLPIKFIQTASDRNDLNKHKAKPGKNKHRLYSLANLIQLVGMNIAIQNGFTYKTSVLIGKKFQSYLIYLIINEYFNVVFEEIIGEEYLDETIMIFSVNKNKVTSYISEDTNSTLIDLVEKFPNNCLHFYPIGSLANSILHKYFELDEKINQALLLGKQKPVPKTIDDIIKQE